MHSVKLQPFPVSRVYSCHYLTIVYFLYEAMATHCEAWPGYIAPYMHILMVFTCGEYFVYFPAFRYAQCLVRSVGLPPLGEEEVRELSLLVREGWRKVAVFFMLRLAMAPCVESLVLLDRAIFLMETNTEAGSQCSGHTHRPVQVQLAPIFDPRISPRNIALIAKR